LSNTESPVTPCNRLPPQSCRLPIMAQSPCRQTQREYFVCSVPDDLPDASRWPKLKAIGMTVNRTLREGKETIEGRYYILSRKLSGKQFAEAVRGHWSIENSLHWQLDVTFGEDHCRIRKGHADTNFSLLRRQALSLLKNERTAKCRRRSENVAPGGEWPSGEKRSARMITCRSHFRLSEFPKSSGLACRRDRCSPTWISGLRFAVAF